MATDETTLHEELERERAAEIVREVENRRECSRCMARGQLSAMTDAGTHFECIGCRDSYGRCEALAAHGQDGCRGVRRREVEPDDSAFGWNGATDQSYQYD